MVALDRELILAKAEEILLGLQSHPRREPGWAYRHGFRTANLALWLRERIFPGQTHMDDALFAAALFHDCAKDAEEDHATAGSIRAYEYLSGIIPAADLPVVTGAIRMHNKRGSACTDLDMVLQDADIVDHFGTIEVWLNISYSVLGGEGPERSLSFYESEWDTMITELRGMMNYELSRKVFDDRVAYNDEFVRRFRIEAAGGVAMPYPV